ncbi:hypothetical protein TNCV_2095181 [Trichonephila clavipes]|nr:hypothetical protein TNCV_2095181 [Trichonephila clavipes]
MEVTDRSVTSRTIAQHIETVTHYSVSTSTIRRNLQHSGLSTRRPLLGLPLTKNHRRIRRPRSVESDLRVSLVNNGLVGPYSATVLVTLPSAPDHRPPRLASARSILPPSLTPGGCLDSALY